MSEEIVTFVCVPGHVDDEDRHYLFSDMRAYPSLTRATAWARDFVKLQREIHCADSRPLTIVGRSYTDGSALMYEAQCGPWVCTVYCVIEWQMIEDGMERGKA